MPDLLIRAPNKYEPMTKNRWLLRFPNDINIQPWQLRSCQAPKKEYSTKEVPFLNTNSYVNTKYKWAAQNATAIDYVAPSTAQAIIEWSRLHAESATGRMGYNVGAAKDLILEQLDPTGAVIRRWEMIQTILTGTLDFGDLSYNDDELLEISFTMQPYYCILRY